MNRDRDKLSDNHNIFIVMELVNFQNLVQRQYLTDAETETSKDEINDLEETLVNVEDDHYLLPSSGHNVYILQPDVKWGPEKKLNTNARLQLAEAVALVKSLHHWSVKHKVIYSLKKPDSRYLYGSGNFATITKEIRRTQPSAVFVSVNRLNSSQLSTMQSAWRLPVYDRFTMVLQIFKSRAVTTEAKLQVALASIPFYRMRMKGIHKGALGRQRSEFNDIGGDSSSLEIKQDMLQVKEQKIRKCLKDLRERRDMLRKNRKRLELPVVAIVGYTNAGKTSLIKSLTGDVRMEADNRLFATLDVTSHKGLLPSNLKVLYIDTVGFISDIPSSLIDAFNATLEDVLLADVIVHVRDVSHPDAEAQRDSVLATLTDLGCEQEAINSMIEIHNKIDLIDEQNESDFGENGIKTSTKSGRGLNELVDLIEEKVINLGGRSKRLLKLPSNADHLGWLHKNATVLDVKYGDDNFLYVKIIITDAFYGKFKRLFFS